MPWKKKLLNNARLYLILDTQVNDYGELLQILKRCVCYGFDVVQLRDKAGSAAAMLEFLSQAKAIMKGRIPFIVNDRVDLALIAKVDGVHLGQDDVPLKDARRILGAKAVIGASCQTLKQAKRAQQEGADYIGFGSVFKTPTKPDRTPMDLSLLHRVVSEIKIPVFAIGGISRRNIGPLQAAGATRVAVCRDICLAKNVSQAIKEFKEILR